MESEPRMTQKRMLKMSTKRIGCGTSSTPVLNFKTLHTLELLLIACDQYSSEAKSLGGNERVQRANCRAGIFESGTHSSVDFDNVMVEQKHIKRRDDCGEQLLFPRPQVRVLCSSLFESV